MVIMEEGKDRVILQEYGVLNTSASDYPGSHSYDTEEGWNHKRFTKNFKIVIEKYDSKEMEFDIIGVQPAIANAFRRLLISDVPSMAIEKVFVYNNTSLIKDEVFAHRLGLIPLKADARLFEYRQTAESGALPVADENQGTEQDTLEFELKIKCTWNPNSMKDSTLSDDIYSNHHVYTRHITWLPMGGQKGLYTAEDVGPIDSDILLNKMRPGHELNLKMHAVKGTGRSHAKFTPVATAFYRLLPSIQLLRDVQGEDAERLQACFSPGVIGIEQRPNGKKSAFVANPRYDSSSRNVTRHEDLASAVSMGFVRNHFIFTIESVGSLPPDVLFIEAVKVLKKRCRSLLNDLNQSSS